MPGRGGADFPAAGVSSCLPPACFVVESPINDGCSVTLPGAECRNHSITKLARIQADSSCRDFILADAKDADMAFGLSAPGHSPEYHGQEARFRTLDEYRQLMREIVHQGLVDIMLMSASSSEVLTLQERLFDNSRVTPAIRANDTTDIWLAAGSGRYASQPSRPFRSATIDHAQCGKVECATA